MAIKITDLPAAPDGKFRTEDEFPVTRPSNPGADGAYKQSIANRLGDESIEGNLTITGAQTVNGNQTVTGTSYVNVVNIDSGNGSIACLNNNLEINNTYAASIKGVINGQTNFEAAYDSTDNTFTVNGKVETDLLKVNTGAADGKFLQSDASGNATWEYDNSIHKEGYTKYCVQGRDDLATVIASITNLDTVVNISQGEFAAATPLVIDKDGIDLVGVPAMPAATKLLYSTSTASTADRINIRYITFGDDFTAASKRSNYYHCTFQGNLNIDPSSTPGFMAFANCEFEAGQTITVNAAFASSVTFVNCNFNGCSFVLSQSSNLQVIFTNCANFVSFPTNCTYLGINALASGFVQNSVAKIELATGSGAAGQVLTSNGPNIPDTWTTISSGGSGDVVGPSSSVDSEVVAFDGTTGKLVKATGKSYDDIGRVILQRFTTTGTGNFTAPTGAIAAHITAYGGGGAGAGGGFSFFDSTIDSYIGGAGGGGASGAKAEIYLNVSGGSTQFYYNIGSGGTAGSGQTVSVGAGSGGVGSITTVGIDLTLSRTLISASGGLGGQAPTGTGSGALPDGGHGAGGGTDFGGGGGARGLDGASNGNFGYGGLGTVMAGGDASGSVGGPGGFQATNSNKGGSGGGAHFGAGGSNGSAGSAGSLASGGGGGSGGSSSGTLANGLPGGNGGDGFISVEWQY